MRRLHLFLALGGCLALPLIAADQEGEAALDNWPHWRGPLTTGVAPRGNPPVEWSAERNVAFKYADPGLGFSSPIVWGERVFLTTAVRVADTAADAEPEQRGILGMEAPAAPREFTVIALDRESGAELWRRVALRAIPHEGHHKSLSSYANISPVTDGETLYASFGSYGLFAYSLDGTLEWSRDFEVQMRMFNRFGESSSPALFGDTLVLSFDQQGQSFVIAVDRRNGETLWRRDRDEDTSWASPYILEHEGRAQVVLSGHNFVRSYDLETGETIWKVSGMTRGPIPTPVAGNGMVFLASGTNGQAFKAVRLGGSGDLSGSKYEVWSLDKGVSYNPTPLLWGGELYMLKDVMSGNTFVSAFDAHTGEAHYLNARLPESWTIKASPVGAAGRIYLSSEEGDVVVLERGPKLKVLAVNSVAEMVLATPAIAGPDLFLRGRQHLFRISETPAVEGS